MAGILLADTKFEDILPASIRSDPTMLAAARTLDVFLADGDAEIGNVLIWSRIDGLEEPLLSTLAFQLHLEGYEGWQMAETVQQKRALIKDSIKLHFYKGTRYTLERIFEILDLTGIIVEWWQAPEDPTFRPYEFDIDIETDHPVVNTFYYDLLDLIHVLKNARSHRRRSRVITTAHADMPFLAPAVVVGMTVTVYPLEDAI